MSQLTDDIQQNYALFIQQAQDSQQVWALQFDDEWVVCDSNEQPGRDVMPVWSAEADAQRHCVDEWADYQAAPIALEEFMEEWVNDLAEDQVLLGINWNADLDGVEVEPLTLARDLADNEL